MVQFSLLRKFHRRLIVQEISDTALRFSLKASNIQKRSEYFLKFIESFISFSDLFINREIYEIR